MPREACLTLLTQPQLSRSSRVGTSERLRDEFVEVMARFAASPAIRHVNEGRMKVGHYRTILREIYHYSKEDPQIQALASVYLRGADRDSVKMFLKHAISEIGHDRMALADMAELGEDVASLPHTNPLPTTMALIAFPFYQIQYANPIGYLGYLYFLEHMPTAAGESYARALAAAGIPASAMTFLNEHRTVDMAHNRLMTEYLRRLVRSDADLAAVAYAMHVTGELYSAMLWGAIQDAEAPRPAYVRFEEAVRAGRDS